MAQGTATALTKEGIPGLLCSLLKWYWNSSATTAGSIGNLYLALQAFWEEKKRVSMYSVGEVTFYGRTALRTTLHFQGLQWKKKNIVWINKAQDGTTPGMVTAQLHTAAERELLGCVEATQLTQWSTGHLLIFSSHAGMISIPCWSIAGSSSLTTHMITLHRLPQQEEARAVTWPNEQSISKVVSKSWLWQPL